MRNTMSYMRLKFCLVMGCLMASGCSFDGIIPPTIAHVHIGHSITGWHDAPRGQGLLVVAELSSISALSSSELMTQSLKANELTNARKHLTQIISEVEPELLNTGKKTKYNLRRATAESITHLKLASQVYDASTNVQRTVARTTVKAQRIVEKIDELTVYLEAGIGAEDTAEFKIIAEEIDSILKQIAGGPDLPDNYGLFDYRNDIESMIALEDPPYRTVDKWFLFNLVKLPNGEWGFRDPTQTDSRGGGGYN